MLMRNRYNKILIYVLLLMLFSTLFSCDRSEPKIAFGFISLTYYQERDKFVERYSFFILPEDNDGFENLEDLYLYHDMDQLRWHLKSSDWIKFSKGGKDWIGSRSISIQEGESLPRGKFRAVLINKGGEKTEKYFSFDGPEDPRFPFPTLEISNGRYAVNSAYPNNYLIFYNERGEILNSVKLTSLENSLSIVNFQQGARSASLWAEDPEHFTSVLTNAASIQ